ncbi:hypothetical protein BJV82DRAFT_673445 [Fennellomyces sp. T-0311]|nr:hypothetical protein BJV82DRAFT_673445 [Fennellomyces sp. T-0311]
MSSVLMFSSTLKELCIARHVSSLEVLPLLTNLPNLSHLTLLNGTTYLSSLSQYTDTVFDKLVYLRLGIVCDFDTDIIPLLRRCPNINALLIHPRQVVRSNTDVVGPKDFDILSQLCPKICYFGWNPFTFRSLKYYQGIPAFADYHHHHQGIKMFEFIGVGPGRDDHGIFTRMMPVIVRAQDSLEHLKLYFDPFRNALFPAGELSHHRFSQLKSLSLGGIRMTADEWGVFFKGLDNILFLEIHIHSNDYHLGAFIIEKLECLTRLKRLRLVWSYFTHARLPALNNVHLLTNCGQLQCLELKRVPLSPRGLLDLCKITSLKKLDLLLYRGDEISYKWLWPFAQDLKNIHDLEYLTLNNFLFLNTGVVVHLTKLENLIQVTICYCGPAYESRVEGLIRYCSKIKRIRADCCDHSNSSVSASYTVWNAIE